MSIINKTQEELTKYALLNQVLDNTRCEVMQIEDMLETLDEDINKLSNLNISAQVVDVFCKSRNELNVSRIHLALRANEIEHAILKYEEKHNLK